MLDVGRKFFTEDYVNDTIEMMGWYKMNEFQIHLSDNEIKPRDLDGDGAPDWDTAYAGFRLASDDPQFAGLASPDGSYTRAQWQGFEDVATRNGVTIIPELDVPAHSLALTNFRPDLRLESHPDQLDLANPDTVPFVESVFAEFAPWFEGPALHFGGDEYYTPQREQVRLYEGSFNHMSGFVADLGFEPRAWGSQKSKSGSADAYTKDVTINAWNNSWFGLKDAQDGGYASYINSQDARLYVVPFADYYHGNGLADQDLYETWLPHMADGQSVEPGQPRGAMWAVWNDEIHTEYSELDVWGLTDSSFPVLATKTWNAQPPTVPYVDFAAARDEIGLPDDLRVLTAPERTGTLEGAEVTASSSAPGHGPESLVDGDRATFWQSAESQATLTVDLGEARQLGSVDITWLRDHAPHSFGVDVSLDGTFWQHVEIGRVDSSSPVDLGRTYARYVRIADIDGGHNPPAARELALTAAPKGVVTASGTEPGTSFSPDLAFDGDPTTRWAAPYTNPRWIQVDLLQQSTFHTVDLRWEAASATAYTMSVSSDGSTWTTVASPTGLAPQARQDSLDVGTVSARYVRVDVTGLAFAPWLSLYEIGIDHESASPIQFTGSVTPAPDTPPATWTAITPEVSLSLAAAGVAVDDFEVRILPSEAGEAGNARSDGGWLPYTGPFTLPVGTERVEYRGGDGAISATGYADLIVRDGDVPTPSPEPTPSPTSGSTDGPTVTPTNGPTTEPTGAPTAGPADVGGTGAAGTPTHGAMAPQGREPSAGPGAEVHTGGTTRTPALALGGAALVVGGAITAAVAVRRRAMAS